VTGAANGIGGVAAQQPGPLEQHDCSQPEAGPQWTGLYMGGISSGLHLGVLAILLVREKTTLHGVALPIAGVPPDACTDRPRRPHYQALADAAGDQPLVAELPSNLFLTRTQTSKRVTGNRR
jgi:hypothetical protein